MSLAKTPDITSASATRAVSTRRTLFGGAAAIVLGSGITAGAAASIADFVQVAIDSDAELLRLTALAGGSTPPPSVDAHLVALGIEGRRVGEKHRRTTADWLRLKDGDPAIDRVARDLEVSYDRMWELYEQALTLKATTPEGWRAKAELIRHFLAVECEDKSGEMEFGNPEQELVWSLVCDLTGRA